MTYADEELVAELCKEATRNSQDSTALDTVIEKGINHAERKINRMLRAAQVKIPIVPQDHSTIKDEDPLLNLFEAGDLYAAKFILDTYYSGVEGVGAPSSYKSDADDDVNGYIEIIREGYNEDDPDTPTEVKIPVGSLVRRY